MGSKREMSVLDNGSVFLTKQFMLNEDLDCMNRNPPEGTAPLAQTLSSASQ